METERQSAVPRQLRHIHNTRLAQRQVFHCIHKSTSRALDESTSSDCRCFGVLTLRICPGFKMKTFTVPLRGISTQTDPFNKVVTTFSSSARARTLNLVPNTLCLYVLTANNKRGIVHRVPPQNTLHP